LHWLVELNVDVQTGTGCLGEHVSGDPADLVVELVVSAFVTVTQKYLQFPEIYASTFASDCNAIAIAGMLGQIVRESVDHLIAITATEVSARDDELTVLSVGELDGRGLAITCIHVDVLGTGW
jgi:hypothetical protein